MSIASHFERNHFTEMAKMTEPVTFIIKTLLVVDYEGGFLHLYTCIKYVKVEFNITLSEANHGANSFDCGKCLLYTLQGSPWINGNGVMFNLTPGT